MFAWFWTFAYGNPGDGLWMIIMSCVVYGMAFDLLTFQDPCLLKRLRILEFVPALRDYL
jgi:hypothetical protein